MIWLEGDIRRFMNGAPVELQRALILAIHTGQRKGDLIRLRWSDYDGDTISLTPSKTSARVTDKCTGTLKRMLDDTPRQGPFILTRADGTPWFTLATWLTNHRCRMRGAIAWMRRTSILRHGMI